MKAPPGEVYVCCRGHVMDEVTVETRRYTTSDGEADYEDVYLCAFPVPCMSCGIPDCGSKEPCGEYEPRRVSRAQLAFERAARKAVPP